MLRRLKDIVAFVGGAFSLDMSIFVRDTYLNLMNRVENCNCIQLTRI